ncbi:SMP-30/gluconolactonase/LRE family protein [Nocardia sp. NPDC050412]|uniref:SMP-30/gluconolactonase/LRE family protein n=1 Tax=unclassified Nocardia TaxID=2637762 RepID=UPI003798A62E
MRKLYRPDARVWAVAALALSCAGIGAPSAIAESEQGAVAVCASAQAATAVPAGLPVLDWSENVGYDAQGNLWVSRLYRNEVQRYDNAGRLTATVPVEFPGAIRLGPDGLLYVVFGDSPTSVLRPGGVVRFDPNDPRPAVFASGFTMPNGAAFDALGNLYVASSLGVIRIRPDGGVDADWTAWAKYTGANGIVVRDNSIYLSMNGNTLGRIVRFPIDDPGRVTVLADLTVSPGIPDFADDFVIDDAGVLYVTTLTGQLIRVDPGTNTACAVLTGEPMTSVVAVPGRSDELLAGTESGAILRIRLPR